MEQSTAFGRYGLTPIKPAPSIGNSDFCGRFLCFRLAVLEAGTPAWFSVRQLGLGSPARHLFGLNRVWRSASRTGPASAAIRRRQPVPAEQAFGADGQVVAAGFDEFEEAGEVVVLDVVADQFPALAVHDADVHRVGLGRRKDQAPG